MACWAQLGFGNVVLLWRVKEKGGNFQNFESVNQTSKVDAKSDKRFLLFSQDISRHLDVNVVQTFFFIFLGGLVSCVFCSVGTRRTSSEASLPMVTWAESACCHKVAILRSSSSVGSRTSKSFRCNSESYTFRRSSSWSQSFGVMSVWEHFCPFCSLH